ncbi:TonB-dependent receptor [Caulobacter vibrioides NA1000]|uniref:TonB-dependent receptor n=1 Tax=Caulobacter vibrioides (strain NA1000 / CB15N) TaxID=565050 RepID=A0A0H3CBS1_CAUVN|nr:TonB-dependent receptor [Caulobacter vibrioides]YP_002518283.1 TonB-dependent receptor [Caulobacter vibrioides NA1000]ACL96375.1 TonB-dependent receptor [Caulobacter vibrioides NA1000]
MLGFVSRRKSLLASSILCGVMLPAAAAWAQQAEEPAQVEEIVVTGSRIARPDLTSSSPIAQVGAAELRASGVVNTENLLNTLPQAVPGITSNVNNGSNGTATVDLRGLGSNRTLVLVDGKRQTPTTQAGSVDLNLIPPALIKAIDVVSGGGSAVYGSDAIAGVVNFILKNDFEGLEFSAGYSETDKGEAPIYSADLTMGANFADRKGNVVLSLGYNKREALTQGQRGGMLARAWGDNAARTGFVPSGSGAIEPGRVDPFVSGRVINLTGLGRAPTSADSALFLSNGDVRRYDDTVDTYNFAPVNYIQTPQERFSVTSLASYEVKPGLTAYAKGNFVNSRVVTQLAPTPVGNRVFRFTLDNNPFLTAAAKTALNGLGSTTAYSIPTSSPWATGTYTDVDTDGDGLFETVTGVFNKRLSDVGPRVSSFNFSGFQIQLGLKGDLDFINGGFDVYYQYGNTNGSNSLLGDTSLVRIQQGLLLNAAGTGCADPSGGCVPVNIFGQGTMSAAAANFIKTRINSSQDYEQQYGGFSINGDTANQFSLPAGPIGFAVGFEYRAEEFAFNPSQDLATGNLTGFNASPPVAGRFDVYEGYAEVLVPLLKDLPLVKSLDLELAGRTSDYTGQPKAVQTYKVAGSWKVYDDLMLRASFNRAIRAPSIGELYAPQSNGFPTATDPCSARAAPNAAVRQACINSGVSASVVGLLNANQQTQTLSGGNPSLRPEEGETLTLGAVYTPSWISGLSFTLDFYNIKVTDAIDTFGGGTANLMNVCYGPLVNGNPNSPYCKAIVRLANGSIDYVVSTNQNVASRELEGLDFGVTYKTSLEDLGLPDWGTLSVRSLYTNTWLYTIKPDDISAPVKCADKFGNRCRGFGVNPVPRHKLRTAANWRFNNVGVNLVWSHLDDVVDDNPASRFTVERIGAKNYVDLSADWDVNDNLAFTGGVRNLTQEAYPILGGNASPSNSGYPAVYDVMGRTFFLNARLRY